MDDVIGKVHDSTPVPNSISDDAREATRESREDKQEVRRTRVPSEAAQTKKQKNQKGERMGRVMNPREDVVVTDLLLIKPTLYIVIGHFLSFAEGRGLPAEPTSIISDRENVQAVSTTHEDGRAIDFSATGWDKKDIEDCISHMNNIAGHYGAISYSDNERRVIVYHNYKNQGDHFHLQVAR